MAAVAASAADSPWLVAGSGSCAAAASCCRCCPCPSSRRCCCSAASGSCAAWCAAGGAGEAGEKRTAACWCGSSTGSAQASLGGTVAAMRLTARPPFRPPLKPPFKLPLRPLLRLKLLLGPPPRPPLRLKLPLGPPPRPPLRCCAAGGASMPLATIASVSLSAGRTGSRGGGRGQGVRDGWTLAIAHGPMPAQRHSTQTPKHETTPIKQPPAHPNQPTQTSTHPCPWQAVPPHPRE